MLKVSPVLPIAQHRLMLSFVVIFCLSFESCSLDNPPHYSFTHNDINICYAAICFALAQYEMSNADDFVRQYIEENHDELLQLRGIFRNFLSLFE